MSACAAVLGFIFGLILALIIFPVSGVEPSCASNPGDSSGKCSSEERLAPDDESPPEGEPDSANSVDEGEDGKSSTVDNSENALSEDELDAIFLKNDDIRDEIETIKRILKRGLSTDDLHHVIGREKELLSELREMRRKLQI